MKRSWDSCVDRSTSVQVSVEVVVVRLRRFVSKLRGTGPQTTHLFVCEIYRSLGSTLFRNRFDEKTRRTNVILVVYAETSFVSRVHHELRSIQSSASFAKSSISSYLKTGNPVTLASLKAVYQTGSMEYLSLMISRTKLL